MLMKIKMDILFMLTEHLLTVFEFDTLIRLTNLMYCLGLICNCYAILPMLLCNSNDKL